MAETSTTLSSKSEQLIEVLSGYDEVLVVMHDNPDPDAIAGGWALICLIEERLTMPARLIGGGAIVRAENKHMVDLLRPPIQLVNAIATDSNAATILVDCSVGTSNQLLTRAGIKPIGVIDHHQNGVGEASIPFYDVRTDVAASACICAGYLREQGIEPGVKLATAILYAIRTETSGSETFHSSFDRNVVKWLAPMADPALLAGIQNAPLEPEYFGDLTLAMQNTYVYDDAAYCFLPRAHGAEIVGEVADLLVRCRGVNRVLCAAVVGDDVLISARTRKDSDNASQLLQTTLGELGGCGGHAHRAGGKIIDHAALDRARQLHEELLSRWLTACQVNRHRARRLVARREIVQHLFETPR